MCDKEARESGGQGWKRGLRFRGQTGAWKQGRLSSVTWENVYRYLIKAVSIVERSMLGCSVAPVDIYIRTYIHACIHGASDFVSFTALLRHRARRRRRPRPRRLRGRNTCQGR